ncbi:MAG: hypothetical protein OXD44_12405 [Gammaproteobacteria bacterium]|nr:hypothetical protein [Gammaproteobacteria bacterium]
MLGVLIESADIIHFMDNGKSYIAYRAKNAVKLQKIQVILTETGISVGAILILSLIYQGNEFTRKELGIHPLSIIT